MGPPPPLDSSYSRPPAALEPASNQPRLYVAPTGNDDDPGTADAPFRTIERAASVVTPGTTVIVADGTYEGAIATEASGREDARITYVSASKWGAKLVGLDSDEDAVWRNTGDYVDIQGFDVSGEIPDGTGIGQSASHGRILENRVTGMEGNCFSTGNIGYTIVDNDIIGNVAASCGTTQLDHGIYPSGDGGVISNNISYGSTGYGIHCWHNCNNQVITNNLVFENEEGGILIGQGDGPNYGEVDADNMLVANNIAIDNDRNGIRESGATGENNRYLNNNVWGNDEGAFDLQSGIEDGSIRSEPLFINFQPDGSGDYRLAPSSPNKDAGTAEGAPEQDIIGVPRPQGDGVDIGVYEQ
jgi:hypothetical protein